MVEGLKREPMCPIHRNECQRDHCAWWCKTKEKCAVYMIADELDAIDHDLPRRGHPECGPM